MEPLLKKNNSAVILNETKEVEGDLKVVSVMPLTYNKIRAAIALLLVILSASMLLFLYIFSFFNYFQLSMVN
jgi:hypothetical protein